MAVLTVFGLMVITEAVVTLTTMHCRSTNAFFVLLLILKRTVSLNASRRILFHRRTVFYASSETPAPAHFCTKKFVEKRQQRFAFAFIMQTEAECMGHSATR